MKIKYILLLVAAAIIWGTGFIMVRIALNNGYQPFFISGFRFIIAAILLGGLLRKQIPTIKKDVLVKGSVLGLCLFLGFSLQTIALHYTSIARNAFITAIYVVIVPFLCWITYKKKPSIAQFSAAAITFIGIRLLSKNLDGTFNIGDFLTFLCSFFFAGHLMLLGIYTKKHSPLMLAALQVVVAALLSFIFMFAFEPLPKFNLIGMLAILYLGAMSSAVAFSLQNIAQKHLSQITASIVLSSEAVFGTLFSVLLLKEQLTTSMIWGAGIIFIAILLAEFNIRTKKQLPL